MHSGETTKPEFGKKYAFYNAGYVINFEAVLTKQRFSTVNVEIAPLREGGKGGYWAKKITLQLSEKDLYAIFFCLNKKRKITYESKYHGNQKNKSITFVEKDGGSCDIKLGDAGKYMQFNCSPMQWFYAKMLIVERILGGPLSMAEAGELLPPEAKIAKST